MYTYTIYVAKTKALRSDCAAAPLFLHMQKAGLLMTRIMWQSTLYINHYAYVHFDNVWYLNFRTSNILLILFLNSNSLSLWKRNVSNRCRCNE